MHDDAPAKAKAAPPSRDERLAAALRANLNRRKQLARSKKGREQAGANSHPGEGESPRDPD